MDRSILLAGGGILLGTHPPACPCYLQPAQDVPQKRVRRCQQRQRALLQGRLLLCRQRRGSAQQGSQRRGRGGPGALPLLLLPAVGLLLALASWRCGIHRRRLPIFAAAAAGSALCDGRRGTYALDIGLHRRWGRQLLLLLLLQTSLGCLLH